MAWDLWGPSQPQVELETTYYLPKSEWQCDFYFGYGHEENALNKKLCLEVVRRLMEKADTEIGEFKKELVSLKSELAWARLEEWNDICCGGSEKMPCDDSVQNFTNEEDNNIKVQSLMHTGSAESIDEKDEQFMTTKQSTGVSSIDGKTILESLDSKPINKVVEHSLIPTADIGISLRPYEHGSDVSKTTEPAEVIANDALKYGNGCSSEVKNQCMPTFTAISQTFLSSLTPENKATLQETNKPVCSLVKSDDQDSLRQSAGIKKSNGCLESRLCASPKKSNVEHKLIDLVPQPVRKVGVKKSKMNMGNKIGCPDKSLKTAGNGSNHRQTVKFEGLITDKEESDQSEIANETQIEDNAGNDSKPVLTLGLKPQRLNRKRKSPLTAQNIQEPCFSSTEISSNTTIISKDEKEHNSKVTDDRTRLNQFSRQCEKAGHLEQCEDRRVGTSHGNSNTSASLLQKKRKMTTSFPHTADTRERTACLGSENLHGDLLKKKKVTSSFTCPAKVKDISLSLCSQDSDRDASNGSIEEDPNHPEKEDPNHPEKEDPKIVEASMSQKQRKMTSTLTLHAEMKHLSSGLGLQDLHKDGNSTNVKTEEDHLIMKSYSGDDSVAENLVPCAISTPIPSQRLQDMTVGKLKELAKRAKLTKYSNLRKMKLVELLAKIQGGC